MVLDWKAVTSRPPGMATTSVHLFPFSLRVILPYRRAVTWSDGFTCLSFGLAKSLRLALS